MYLTGYSAAQEGGQAHGPLSDPLHAENATGAPKSNGYPETEPGPVPLRAEADAAGLEGLWRHEAADRVEQRVYVFIVGFHPALQFGQLLVELLYASPGSFGASRTRGRHTRSSAQPADY